MSAEFSWSMTSAAFDPIPDRIKRGNSPVIAVPIVVPESKSDPRIRFPVPFGVMVKVAFV